MPEGTWWGLRFLDSKYLGNWKFSPYIEVFRHEGDVFKVKISGSHDIEPSLTGEQSLCMEFLGWVKEDREDCDCLFSPYLDREAAIEWCSSAINALQVVFGISDLCAIVGSNNFVHREISKLEESRWSRKLGGYRLSKALYNRIELR